MEMSIGTIVIIVLAMSMLILGMVLVKNIFSGASENVKSMNAGVQDEINKMFTEDKKTVVYLSNKIAKIKQNEQWGIAIGIKNLQKGVAGSGKFSYEVFVSDSDVKTKCGIGENDIEKWIVTRRTDSFELAPGEQTTRIVRFLVPESAPLCTISFNIEVERNGVHYATDFLYVEVLA